MQKSRKAVRLYSSVGRLQQEGSSELSEAQVREWRNINAELLRQLSFVMERPQSKTLVSEVIGIRDHFYTTWRETETELHLGQKQLVTCSENGDFVKAAILSQQLVTLKARMQASQAAHHEFNEVIRRCRVPEQARTIELSDEHIYADKFQSPLRESTYEEPQLAKVIPLRRASS